jgi:uncharacterized protein (DUF1778 family)
MEWTSVRVPPDIRDLWYAASRVRGVSQSVFLRDALRTAAVKTIAEARAEAVADR